MDDNKEKKDPRKYLHDLYESIKIDAEDNSRVGIEFLITNKEILDIADFGSRTAEIAPDNSNWEASIEAAEHLKLSMDETNKVKYPWLAIKTVLDTSGSVSLTSSTGIIFSSPYKALEYNGILYSKFTQLQKEITIYVDNKKYDDRVSDLMIILSFDNETNGKIAIMKFKNAWSTFRIGISTEDPALGPLISLRSSIEITIQELIRRLPEQKKTKKKNL